MTSPMSHLNYSPGHFMAHRAQLALQLSLSCLQHWQHQRHWWWAGALMLWVRGHQWGIGGGDVASLHNKSSFSYDSLGKLMAHRCYNLWTFTWLVKVHFFIGWKLILVYLQLQECWMCMFILFFSLQQILGT